MAPKRSNAKTNSVSPSASALPDQQQENNANSINNMSPEQFTNLVVTVMKTAKEMEKASGSKRDRAAEDEEFTHDEEDNPTLGRKRRIFEKEADAKAALFARQFDFPKQIFPSKGFYISTENLADVQGFVSRQPLSPSHRRSVNERLHELTTEMNRYLKWANLMNELEMDDMTGMKVKALLEENSLAWLNKATVVCFNALFPYVEMAEIKTSVSLHYEKYTSGVSNTDVLIAKWYNLAIDKMHADLSSKAQECAKKYEQRKKGKNFFRGE